jgi:hypothetical protein
MHDLALHRSEIFPEPIDAMHAEAHQSFLLQLFHACSQRTKRTLLHVQFAFIVAPKIRTAGVCCLSLEMQTVNRVMTLLQYMMYDGVVLRTIIKIIPLWCHHYTRRVQRSDAARGSLWDTVFYFDCCFSIQLPLLN